MEKIFVRYPNFRSSTKNSDPCIKNDVYSKCRKRMVFITSGRFLGDEAQKKFAGSSRKHPYVIIADTLGCNLRCWFCYSHQFWSIDRSIKHGCNPTYLSSEDIVSQIKCKIEKLIEAEHLMIKKPVIRIRFSGWEPIFATKEIMRHYESDKPSDYKLGIDFWIEVFKELDNVISDLKKSGKIILINEDEWDFQDEWPVFITDSPGRVNIRFDTNGIAFGNNEESRRVNAEEGLAYYFIERLFDIHRENKLQNIKIWIDYSFKGVTPNEYFWSQRTNLPSTEDNITKDYSIEDVPLYSGYKNLLVSIINK